MAGETRISQSVEKALVLQEPSFIPKTPQIVNTVLVQVEPPPTFVRAQQTLETALIEQAAPGRDPSFSVGSRQQVLISEDRLTLLTGNNHRALIQEAEPFFPAQLSQIKQQILLNTELPLNGIPVNQVINKTLIVSEAALNGSLINQVVQKTIVQTEGPSRAPLASSVYHTALYVDTSTASKIRAPSINQVALIQEEAATANIDRSRKVVSTVSKSVTMPLPSSLRSFVNVPAVAVYSATPKTFSLDIQSNALVASDSLLISRMTTPADPGTVMSPARVSSAAIEVVCSKPSTNPGSSQSMSNVPSLVTEVAKPVLKVQPSSIQSDALVKKQTLICAKAKMFSTDVISSMSEVAGHAKLVARSSTYPQAPISDALIKKVSRTVARVAQYPDTSDLRSQVLISATSQSTCFKDDSYVQPELIQATTMISNVFVMTSRPRFVRDPGEERSQVMVGNEASLVSKQAVFVDPTPISPDTELVRGVCNMLAMRATYFDPLSPDNARRDSYGTYYVVLDNK